VSRKQPTPAPEYGRLAPTPAPPSRRAVEKDYVDIQLYGGMQTLGVSWLSSKSGVVRIESPDDETCFYLDQENIRELIAALKRGLLE